MPENISHDLSQAVLHTLIYSDVFDYPLTAQEVHRFLHGVPATYEQVVEILNIDPRITSKDTYYTLVGREDIIGTRKERERHSQELLPYALRYGQLLGHLPFVRMVTLTGSLAVMNVSHNSDFDYMLVTVPGHLWTARALVLLLGRLTRLLGHTICPNLIISQSSLKWNKHDLYSAREFCQMIPIAGKGVYHELIKSNQWVISFLPNAYPQMTSAFDAGAQSRNYPIQKFFESFLSGKVGNHFERWEMNRKVARFSQQAGFGEETVFNADICQGNFDHHRQWTQHALQQRLKMAELMAKAS